MLAIFFTGFIITDIKDYKERKIKSVQGIAKVIAANNISTLQFQDVEEATKVLSELKNIAPDIIAAVIVDKKGQLFARYVKNEHDTIANYKLHTGSFEFVDDHLYVTNVITTDSNETLGKVYINCELTELAEMTKTKLSIAGISLIFSLVAGFLIAYIIQTYVSKRLLFLVSKMEETSKTNNYNVVIKDDGKDEIGRLFKVYNDLMQQVNESQQKKDEFIGIASHELKTPLTSIKGYIELLSDMEEREPQKQFVQRTAENIRKLEMLIKDLLDVSKINSGQLTLNLSEFNIKDLVEDTILSMQTAQAKHEIIKQLDFKDVIIKGDSQRIEQVLVNLLSNAVKYSPDGNKIFVSGKTNNSDIVIKVKDFGKGIPESEHTKIFDRFYRSKNASTHISGFGLGLYICNDIIKRHNGKIWVESNGQGSSFYFSLPMKENL
ncbi:MAG: ATP-binding protein [Bacteroidota bacterium]